MSRKQAHTQRRVIVEVGSNGPIGPALLSALIDEHTRRKHRIRELLSDFSRISGCVILDTTIAVLRKSDRSYIWDLVFFMCDKLGATIEVRPPRKVALVFSEVEQDAQEPVQTEAA